MCLDDPGIAKNHFDIYVGKDNVCCNINGKFCYRDIILEITICYEYDCYLYTPHLDKMKRRSRIIYGVEDMCDEENYVIISHVLLERFRNML